MPFGTMFIFNKLSRNQFSRLKLVKVQIIWALDKLEEIELKKMLELKNQSH